MSSSKFGVLGLVATGALLAGCSEETVGSDVIRTGGIWAEYTVTATRADQANAKAALKVGGPDADTLAVLVSPDTLLVSASDEEKTMTASGCESNRYCARLNQNLGGEEVVFNFDRNEDSENAPDSRVTMPEPFTLSLAEESFERGQPVTFGWNGSGGSLRWEIKGNCIWTEDGVADDDGTYSIRPELIRERSGRADDECDVTLTVTRSATGSVDSRFAGGTITAVQERKVTFISYPEGADVPDPTDTDDSTNTSDTSTGEPDATPTDGTPEAGSPEAGSPEAGSPEAGSPEAGSPEAGSPEAGSPEAGSPEAGSPEAGSPEAGPVDAGDGGMTDAATEDGGSEVDGGADAGDAGDAG